MSRSLPLPAEPTGDTWILPAGSAPPSVTVLEDKVLAGLVHHLRQHPNGATLEDCDAAVQRVAATDLVGAHRVLTLMRWASANRGIEFRCIDGLVTCDLPANLELR